jgi:N6-L-threonylcarbamoyladenine synthase
MQKLVKRNTYTPTNVSQVRSNCDQPLKALRERGGVSELKTLSNSPDATLTAKGQAEQNTSVSVVYVLNMQGNPLMPCKPQKAKKLLKSGKAKVIKLTPFTIQLLQHSGETKQSVVLGVDSGYHNIGFSAITEKKEVYAAEVLLRKDIVKLNAEKREYRKNRRFRKKWYRKKRFLNRRNKKKGWLPPSIKHKLDSHIKLIESIKKFLPISKIIVEVASFDIQKIKNPKIQKEDYQRGELLGFFNVREYVLYRDNHTCKHCRGRSKDSILNIHHIISRQIGGDRPDNLITLCKTCHQKYHKKEINLKIKKLKDFKAESFMSSIRWRLINALKERGNIVSHTYGYKTKFNRIVQNLKKSHITDAFIIAGGTKQQRQFSHLFIKQVRNCNRKLFKGIRSHIKNTLPRFIGGFQRFDRVLWKGMKCFIFGRRKTLYFNLRKLNGSKIHASAKAKDCILLETFKTFLTERRKGVSSNV